MPNSPPIWVISLKRAQDRRAFVQSAFTTIGLKVELIDAVDGLALEEQDLESYSEWRAMFEYGAGLTRGFLGASLSHLHVWQELLDRDMEYVAVFEDDVEPLPGLLDVLDAVDAFPPDWQVVTLHSLFESARPKPIPDRRIGGQYHLCEYEGTPLGAQGYLINRAGAQRLLDVGFPVCLPPDELLFRKRPARLVVYGIEPTVLIHREFESEIRRNRDRTAPVARKARLPQRAVWAAGVIRRRALRRWAGRV